MKESHRRNHIQHRHRGGNPLERAKALRTCAHQQAGQDESGHDKGGDGRNAMEGTGDHQEGPVKKGEVCHGQDGEPTSAAVGLGTPDLRDGSLLAGRSEEDLERIIREGGENMPAYDSALPDETIHALVHKVRSLSAP